MTTSQTATQTGQSMIDIAQIIVEKGHRTPAEVWLPTMIETRNAVKQMRQPLGHGTSLGLISSILAYGLGTVGRKPRKSTAPLRNSVCALTEREGWLDCYRFATRNRPEELAVNSDALTGVDIIERFAEVNVFLNKKSSLVRFFYLKMMRRAAKKYAQRRGDRPEKEAMYLIYDGEGKAVCDFYSTRVPSEADCKVILTHDYLRYVFVPAERCTETLLIARNAGCNAKVLPIEIMELDTILRFAQRYNP